eukprot:TRINITY_DN4945_c0_g1_i1.p1 TRINITY_DN4945_c0_g1~~TRINITY_DN4945_c0_g1_i1.p1  ORF type:complete len:412 (-),score=78.10 TRINITY_DN4945_c0_g1_i1:72-1307(-)
MEAPKPPTTTTYKIAVFPGDGIGEEVMREALKTLDAVTERFGLKFDITESAVGGVAYDLHGHPLPPQALKLAKESDAILFGAVGGQKWDNLPLNLRPEAAILGLRKELDLYANLRPTQSWPALIHRSPIRKDLLEPGVDILFIRELTAGQYFGLPKGEQEWEGKKRTVDTNAYTDDEIRRVLKIGFEQASKRSNRLCSVDKANVMATGRRWRELANEMSGMYPHIQLSHMYADNCAMQLILNPRSFDVIVTENTFGDILTDLGAVIPGSIGLLPSGSIGGETYHGHPSRALYEPIHGSAPDIAGKGIANPIGMILCVAMMLRLSFGENTAAAAVERAVAMVIEGGYFTPDLYSEPVEDEEDDADDYDGVVNRRRPDVSNTVEIGDKIAHYIRETPSDHQGTAQTHEKCSVM